MTRDEAREAVLRMEPTFLQRAKVSGYVCPECGNGKGSSGDGIALYKSTRHYKCFTCGLYADIVELWKIHSGTDDNKAAFDGLYDYFNIQIDAADHGKKGNTGGKDQKNMKEEKREQTTAAEETGRQQEPEGAAEKEPEDLTVFFLQANKDLDKTDYHRGIRFDTLNRYKVGYMANWKASENAPGSPRLIIPTSKYSYIARDTRHALNDKEKAYQKMKKGPVHVFNMKRLPKAEKPVFIVEGEIDALSIIDVGGEAVGIGSINMVDKFLRQLEAIRNEIKQPFIISLDNEPDKPQVMKAVEKLKKGLERLEIPFIEYDPCLGEKDANDALQRDREAFTKAVEGAYKINIPPVPAADPTPTKDDRLQKIAELMEELRESDTFSERRRVEREILKIANGDDRPKTTEEQKEEYRHNSAGAHLQDFIDGIAASVNTPCIPTGFDNLDEALDGGLYEGLYIIGALSSLGKTTLMLQMMDNIAKAGHDVLIFSLEMARSELMAKSISRETKQICIQERITESLAKTARGITAGKRYEKYSSRESEIIKQAMNKYNEYADHVYILEGIGDIGVKEIRESVEKHISITGNRPVVLIDYLQIMAPADPRATDKQNTDKAILELKRLSRDYKLTVWGISSFNRQSYDKAVGMDAYKESGSIEYSSDVLIGLQFKGVEDEKGKQNKDFDVTAAKKKDPREIELVILKNRNGRVGEKIQFEYQPMFNRYEEI